MIDSKDLEKAIVEGIKAIALAGVEKPDTPDIDTIKEVNNPEGIQPQQMHFSDYDMDAWENSSFRFVIVNANANEYRLI